MLVAAARRRTRRHDATSTNHRILDASCFLRLPGRFAPGGIVRVGNMPHASPSSVRPAFSAVNAAVLSLPHATRSVRDAASAATAASRRRCRLLTRLAAVAPDARRGARLHRPRAAPARGRRGAVAVSAAGARPAAGAGLLDRLTVQHRDQAALVDELRTLMDARSLDEPRRTTSSPASSRLPRAHPRRGARAVSGGPRRARRRRSRRHGGRDGSARGTLSTDAQAVVARPFPPSSARCSLLMRCARRLELGSRPQPRARKASAARINTRRSRRTTTRAARSTRCVCDDGWNGAGPVAPCKKAKPAKSGSKPRAPRRTTRGCPCSPALYATLRLRGRTFCRNWPV